jgi:GNAT superfamily N-acetyltransferase
MFFKLYLSKIQRNLADYGAAVLVTRITGGLIGILFKKQTYRIYRRDLQHDPGMDSAGLPDGMEWITLNGSESDLVAAMEEEAEWLSGTLSDRIRNGLLAVALVDKSAGSSRKLAAWNLVAFGTVYIPLLEMSRTFKAGSAWSEHITVNRDYRKQGLAKALRGRVMQILAREKVRWFYGGCLKSNRGSLALATSLSFRQLADVTLFKVPGKRWYRTRRVR